MTSEILVGSFAIAGSIIGSIGAIVAAKVNAKNAEVLKTLTRLARQVESFHKLEELYKHELASLQKRNPETVMKEMRDRVENAGGYARPKMTQSEAKTIFEKWS